MSKFLYKKHGSKIGEFNRIHEHHRELASGDRWHHHCTLGQLAKAVAWSHKEAFQEYHRKYYFDDYVEPHVLKRATKVANAAESAYKHAKKKLELY